MAPGYQKSKEMFEQAQMVIPGGVNSPVRAFKSVGMTPPFIARANGSRLWDADGNEYIDYVCSWGPLILGHRHPAVMHAIQRCLERGTTYGAPTDLELTLAQMVVEALPSVEMVRMVNSGTEATMSALRLARAYTNRSKIVKFEGCYHGHHDSLLIKAGSGALTHGVPTSPGVPENIAGDTINARYNDLELLEKIFAEAGSEIAAVIVEPLAGNMGVVPPAEGFLQGLRNLCNKYGALLIFDEVITGFRLSYGGAQSYYNVMPDLTCLGKIIGGGLPVGAYGGRREIMQMVSPAGPVYQAGTLSGNPLAMTAGIATLEQLQQPGVYEELNRKSALLAQGLSQAARAAGVPASFNRVESLQTCFFTGHPVNDFASASTSDTKRYAAFFRSMLEQGIYLAPSQFEAIFVSTAHTDSDIERTVEAAYHAYKAAAQI
ncbi:glutamate-1-semialdehyde 2,1-aminomutase [Desulforamulus putei]|uniref:glutamate-1-semialdehyde 2,1-aminomutase n=1 Tax=Desulforamulus putei TaxID=74701 RepID=UPI002FDEF7B4